MSVLAKLAEPPDYAVPVALVAVSAAVALAIAFVGRTRLTASVAFLLLALCGAGIGLGAGAIEFLSSRGYPREPGAEYTQWAIATILLAVLTPLHVRVVLGPFGRRG